MMLKRTPPRRTFQTFIGHAPIVTIINTKLLHKRALCRERYRRAQALAKTTSRNNPFKYYPVKLRALTTAAIVAGLKFDDERMRPKLNDDQAWRKLIGEAIEQAVESDPKIILSALSILEKKWRKGRSVRGN